MSTQTLEPPATLDIHSAREEPTSDFEPNFGPSDMHAIKAIFGIVVSICSFAMVMYGALAVAAYFRAGF